MARGNLGIDINGNYYLLGYNSGSDHILILKNDGSLLHQIAVEKDHRYEYSISKIGDVYKLQKKWKELGF
jgi:hypothetical protein